MSDRRRWAIPLGAALAALVAVLLWLWLRPVAAPVVVTPTAAPSPTTLAPIRAPIVVPAEPVAEGTEEAEGTDEFDPATQIRCAFTTPVSYVGTVKFIPLIAKDDATGVTTHTFMTAEVGPDGLVGQKLGLGVADVEVPGFLDAKAHWTTDEAGKTVCEPIVLTKAVVVHGQVIPRLEGRRHYVRGCDGFASVDDDGHFDITARPGEPCELKAERSDGDYTRFSDPVVITPVEGLEVVIRISATSMAGMTAEIEPVDDGYELVRFRAGSGLDLAGLKPGDVITAVDGVDLADFDGELGELTIGDAGEVLQLSVRRGEERWVVPVTRVEVPSARQPVSVPGGIHMEEPPGIWVGEGTE